MKVIVDLIAPGRSLVYSEKSVGPKTLPCGIPAVTFAILEGVPVLSYTGYLHRYFSFLFVLNSIRVSKPQHHPYTQTQAITHQVILISTSQYNRVSPIRITAMNSTYMWPVNPSFTHLKYRHLYYTQFSWSERV